MVWAVVTNMAYDSKFKLIVYSALILPSTNPFRFCQKWQNVHNSWLDDTILVNILQFFYTPSYYQLCILLCYIPIVA